MLHPLSALSTFFLSVFVRREHGNSSSQFGQDVIFDKNVLFIIAEFSQGVFLRKSHELDIGNQTCGEFHQPHSIVVHPDLDMVISLDRYHQRVQMFRKNGEPLSHWDLKAHQYHGMFSAPSAIAIHSKLNRIFLVDAETHCFWMLPLDGEPIDECDFRGRGGFDYLCAISLLPDNDLVFIADRHKHQIIVYTLDSILVRRWGSRGEYRGCGFGKFICPSAIVAHPNQDLVFVSESTSCRIQCFQRNGTFIFQWNVGVQRHGHFYTKHLALDTNRNILFVSDTNVIFIYDLTGKLLGQCGYEDFWPESMTFDAVQDELYVVSQNQRKVEVFALQLRTVCHVPKR